MSRGIVDTTPVKSTLNQINPQKTRRGVGRKLTAFFLLFLASSALKMSSATSIEGDEFDDYSQDELFAIIQEVEKCEREEFGEESDVDVGGEESEDGDISGLISNFNIIYSKSKHRG